MSSGRRYLRHSNRGRELKNTDEEMFHFNGRFIKDEDNGNRISGQPLPSFLFRVCGKHYCQPGF